MTDPIAIDAPSAGASAGRPPRGRAARAALLDAAERLFSARGFEAVSLREIAVAAGQRNVSAVAYHFGDKHGLVDALVEDRMARIEAECRRLTAGIADLEAEGAAALLHLLWQPVVDLHRETSIRWFTHYQNQRGTDADEALRHAARYPASRRIRDALRARHGHLPEAQFDYRMNLVAMMFWSAASWHDGVVRRANQGWSSRFLLDEVVKVAVGALAAPA